MAVVGVLDHVHQISQWPELLILAAVVVALQQVVKILVLTAVQELLSCLINACDRDDVDK
jgi:hypothetical protein